MKKIAFTIFTVLFLFTGICSAQSYQLKLTAGSSNVNIDFNALRYLESGYFKAGAGGYFKDDGDKKYQILHGKIGVGSESLADGLKCDLGFKGLFGKVENDDDDGNGGGLGFNAEAVYLLPERVSPIPIEIFGGLTWAPNVLSFSDLEEYQEFNLGVGVYFVENASVVLAYRYSDFDMEDDWDLQDNVFSIGLAINF